MKPYDSAVAREAAKQIHELIGRITESIIMGYMGEKEYARECGIISGLKRSLDVLEDAEVFNHTGKHIWEIEEEQNKNAISSYES
jgi:hypothetical protein